MTDDSQDSPYDFAQPQPARTTHIAASARQDARLQPQQQQQHTCLYCGLLVFGNPRARCPECSAPMDDSATDLLQFAEPRWTRSVALALPLIAAAIVGHAAGAFFRWTSPRIVEATVHAAAAGILLVGVFLATRPDRQTSAPARQQSLLACLAATVTAIAWLVLLLIAMKLLGRAMTKSLLLLAVVAQGFLAAVLGFYARSLAMRLPDDTIAAHARIAGWLTTAVCGTVLVIQFLELTTIVHLMFFMCSFPMIAGFFVALLFAVVTLLRLTVNMLEAARSAQRILTLRQHRMSARDA
jgi:hypothetical protein